MVVSEASIVRGAIAVAGVAVVVRVAGPVAIL
jgi:hypothetical protein